MDQELLTFLDQRFTEVRDHAQGLAAETRRHFDVVAEGLRSDMQTIAEGHAGLSRQLDE